MLLSMPFVNQPGTGQNIKEIKIEFLQIIQTIKN